jgi:hypothetical protein
MQYIKSSWFSLIENLDINNIGPFLKFPMPLFSPAAALSNWGWLIWLIYED